MQEIRKRIGANIKKFLKALYQIEQISRDDLQHRVKDLEHRKGLLASSDAAESRLPSAVKIQSRAKQTFLTGEIKERRAIVDALIRSIVVMPDDIKVFWSF